MNPTHQMNEINEKNQIDQTDQRNENMTNEDVTPLVKYMRGSWR